MSRIRYIKPDFWKDEDISELSHQARLFYIGLWNFADKAGRLEHRPKWLKAEIFPYENIDISKLILALSNNKARSKKPFIQIYIVDNQEYIQILAWEKHQKPHHQETESKIPNPPTLTLMEKGTEKGIGMESVLDEPTPKDFGLNTEPTPKLKIKEIIDDLNLVLKTSYKYDTKNTIMLIVKLLEKYTIEDFKTVHRKKFAEWKDDPNMSKYLRPETLYGSKFESYLNQMEVKSNGTSKQSNRQGSEYAGLEKDIQVDRN